MLTKVHAMAAACPLPVVQAQNAIKELGGAGTVEVKVDNEIAVQNLGKMAQQKGYGVSSEKVADGEYTVTLEVGEAAAATGVEDIPEVCAVPAGKKKVVVAVNSNRMGTGNDELGAVLIKGFLFALTQQDELPSAVLFYNGGATLTTEGSASLEDLKNLAAQGVEILTCGTCLNYYGLTDKLAVGSVTNMYDIVATMTSAGKVIRP